MDDFSDFQMAVGPPPLSSKNSSRGNDFWGLGKAPINPNNNNCNGSGSSPHIFHQQQYKPTINPPPSPNKSGVGSRLANYNLGSAQIEMPANQGSHHPPTNGVQQNNLLIGEEDKYAALRDLDSLDFNDLQPEKKQPASLLPNCSNSNTSAIEPEKDDDEFGDFGDFQSFSLPVPTPQPPSVSSINNPIEMLLPKQINIEPKTTITTTSDVQRSEFGGFVSVDQLEKVTPKASITSHNNSLAMFWEEDCKISPCSQKGQDIFGSVTDKNETGISSKKDKEQGFSLSFSFSDINLPTTSTGLTVTTPQQQNSTSLLEDINFDLTSDLQNSRISQHEFKPIDFCCESNSVPSPTSTSVSNGIISETTTTSTISNCGLKTSLIDYDSHKTINSIDSSETMKSASLMEMESSMENLDMSIEQKSKCDVSPETRSIASLDLGGYYPASDLADCKGINDNVQGFERSLSPSYHLSSSSVISSNHHETDSLQMDTVENGELHNNYATDKYQCFREESSTQITNWSKCLKSIKEILVTAVNLFSSVSTSQVIREVVLQERGECFVHCLMEVYKVFNRIQFSCRRLKEIEEINLSCNEIKNLWETLTNFLIGTSVADLLTRNESLSNLGDSGKGNCGICQSVLTDCVSYEGVLFHPGCANLWINNVDPKLPLASRIHIEPVSNNCVSNDISIELL